MMPSSRHPENSVSVVIAAKNEAPFVEAAVRSILGQNDVEHELIFVDDGSDDGTYEIVSGLAADHACIRLVRNPGRGKVSAFNHGVAISRGDYVCLFAGDDIMPPGALAARVAAVQASPSEKPVLGLCRLVTMSEDPRTDGHYIPKAPDRGAYSGLCYMFDRRCLSLMWPIPEDLPNEDTWLEVAAQHLDLHVVHSGVVGAQWRLHSGNSINFMLTYEEFDRRLSPRMAAAARFLEMYGDRLSEERRSALQARVDCENARRRGDLIGVLISRVGIVDRLRAASLSNATLYKIRAKLYGLLSGW